jgi:ABC-type uncharacterized transport system substrate-binding protein
MKLVFKIWLMVFGFMCICVWPAAAQDKGNFSVTPKTNHEKKWRVGYYEGGEYLDYQQVFMATVKELMALGWIRPMDIPEQQGEQTRDLWKWLGKNIKSDYIEFAEDGHYSADWDEARTKETVEAIISRLNTKKDIHLMIAAGTTAGQGLANNRHSTPTLVISSSDPIGAGIVKSREDSGFDHVMAQVDPFRYERQIRVFHDIIGFKTLGVAYADTKAGRTYAAIHDIEKLSQQLGFEVVRCYTQDEIPDVKLAEETVKNCFRDLSQKVDAIYVTAQNGVNPGSIPELVKIVNAAQIPTFAQASSDEVKAGFLMSISQAGWKYVGHFFAENMAKIFNGAKPGQLDQLFEEPPKIAINLKTAELIQYDPPVDVLGSADEIYTEIKPAKK